MSRYIVKKSVYLDMQAIKQKEDISLVENQMTDEISFFKKRK